MILVHDEIAGGAGVLVLGVLGQRPHVAAPCAVYDGVRPGDQQPLGDIGAFEGDLLGIAQHPHGLAPVHGRALHLRLQFKPGKLRPVRRIAGVSTHVVEALAGLLGALIVAAGPFVVGVREAAGARILVNPSIGAAQIEHLPGFRHNGLASIHAPNLDALAKPPDNPVGPCSVEHPGEPLCALALQVIQMPLAGQDLVLAAQLPQPALGHLLGVNADWMMQAALPSSPQRDHRPGQLWTRRPPGPASGPGVPGPTV